MRTPPHSGSDFRLKRLAGGRRAGRFESLAKLHRVEHLVTTRDGPAMPADPDPEALAKPTEELRDHLGLEAIAWCRQVHGAEVLVAREHGALGRGDALVTNRPGLGLMGRSADCPLILIADRGGRAVGMAHASWRGTVGRIAAALVRSLADRFEVRPENCVAAIGPSAGPCCYEVGPEVREAAISGIGPHAREFFAPSSEGRRFDLWRANAAELARSGLRAEDIHVAGLCTICRGDLFPSYRREGASAGRFAAVIGLRPAGGASRGSA